jgi:hypothetical protein
METRETESIDLELWSVGDEATARFAVCDREGAVLCDGAVPGDAGVHPAWRIGPHTVAAAAAIRLAGRMRMTAGGIDEVVRLRLHVSAPAVDRRVLAFAAVKAGVDYVLEPASTAAITLGEPGLGGADVQSLRSTAAQRHGRHWLGGGRETV